MARQEVTGNRRRSKEFVNVKKETLAPFSSLSLLARLFKKISMASFPLARPLSSLHCSTPVPVGAIAPVLGTPPPRVCPPLLPRDAGVEKEKGNKTETKQNKTKY